MRHSSAAINDFPTHEDVGGWIADPHARAPQDPGLVSLVRPFKASLGLLLWRRFTDPLPSAFVKRNDASEVVTFAI